MNRLLTLPRELFMAAPTPLQLARRLSEVLGVEVWFKREDLSGLGFGGNKTRVLEYPLGEALARGCDCLITGGGPQSNWAMLAAVAARRSGLDPYLVYYGSATPATGNHHLAKLIDADIRFTDDPERASVDTTIDELTATLRTAGRRPYVLPRGGATALGAAGYVAASLELAAQLQAERVTPDSVWLATGSCTSQAGLLAGARWLHAPYAVTGIAVSRPLGECVTIVADLAEQVADLLGIPAGDDPRDVNVLDGYHGPGYGRRSVEGDAAARLVAKTEGIFLDPIFAAKAMAALLDQVRDGQRVGPVIFLATGGAPTVFIDTPFIDTAQLS